MLTFTHDQNGLEIVRAETSILLSGRSSLGISQSREEALDEALDVQSAGEAGVDKVTTFKRVGDGINVFLSCASWKVYKLLKCRRNSGTHTVLSLPLLRANVGLWVMKVPSTTGTKLSIP